jgi:hypothetical protein
MTKEKSDMRKTSTAIVPAMPASAVIAAGEPTPETIELERIPPEPITRTEYNGLQVAFDHFNRELFGGALPNVLIVLQRHAHSRGHFSASKYASRGGGPGKQHELALNPDHFVERSDEEIVSTLVHEMVHLWQHRFGRPAKRGYHNREWAAKMKAIGLYPSKTGAPGGREIGAQCSHFIMRPGPFEQSYERLAATGWRLNLESAFRPGPSGTNTSKTKFSCRGCGCNAWGKADLQIACMRCSLPMMSADSGSYEQQQAAE